MTKKRISALRLPLKSSFTLSKLRFLATQALNYIFLFISYTKEAAKKYFLVGLLYI